MKKLFVTVLVFTNVLSLKAQSYLGFLTDNYAGVHGVISNPANIVDSRFRTDINLVSFSAGAANDAFGVNVFDIINNSNYKFNLAAKKSYTSNNNFQTNFDILGPSFMFNINKNNSIALFSRGRAIANLSNVDGEFFNKLDEGFSNSNNFVSTNQNFNIVQNTWAEFGLTYAFVFTNNPKHFFKAGITAKYLSGITNNYLNVNNLSLNYAKTSSTDANLNVVNTTGVVTVGGINTSGNYNDDFTFNAGTGFGADLGFIYEYRPNIDELKDLKDKNKYLIKIGASLTDFGSINYSKNRQNVYNVNGKITEQDYNNNSIDNLLLTKYVVTQNALATKYSLPTSVHFNVDWNINNRFYVNANADFNTNSKTAINTNTLGNNYALTPRYESKWFSFFVPLNVMEYSGFQAGAGLRFGPIFLGSGSIITNLISDNSKAADIYFGAKVPIYQGRIKDRDKDGILDKKDECLDEAGPLENKGCPYRDSDKDSVLDKDDKCPELAGAAENQGCPYPDTDKDSVLDKDDKCIDEVGPAENNGCPYLDTDKDSVLDKDDKCPTVFGIVALQGCPEEKKAEIVEPVKVEVAAEVIKKINEFSKTILFDTGKATLKTESNASLDAIVIVLNEYQSANFKIEGHTDSAGVPAKNLKLSKERAIAVKQYLIDKGVRADRLTSDGYGSKKPIASNKTPKGKNLNRRVEINLVK